MNKRLKKMIDDNLIPNKGGVFIDANNQQFLKEMKEIKNIGQISSSQNSRVIDPEGISYAVTNGHKDGEPKIIEPIGCAMRGRNPENPSERGRSNGKYKQRIEMGSNISNTITSVQKDSLVAEPLRIPQATAQGYVEVEPGSLFDGSYPNSKTRRGRVQDNGQSRTTLTANGEPPYYYEGTEEWKTIIGNKQMNPFRGDVDEISPCITSACGAGGGMTPMLTDAELETTKTKDFIEQVRAHQPMNYRIRKLTPRECFRLMGVSEQDIDKIQAVGISNSRQYQLAGNSIVVDVLEHIFRKLLVDRTQETQQLWMF